MRASALSTATALNQQMHFVCFGRIVSYIRGRGRAVADLVESLRHFPRIKSESATNRRDENRSINGEAIISA